jgi:hypothetical protein
MGGSSISNAATRARGFKTMVSTKSAIEAEAMMKCLPAMTALTQSQASQIAIRDKGVSGDFLRAATLLRSRRTLKGRTRQASVLRTLCP